jgi:para-aminobenzoate synthetase component I
MKTELFFDNLTDIKQKVYNFSSQFDTCCICDSNEMPSAYKIEKYELLAGYGLNKIIHSQNSECWNTIEQSQQWIFGQFNYQSPYNESLTHFLFEPKIVFLIVKNTNKIQLINNGISEIEFNELINKFRKTETVTEKVKAISLQFEALTQKEDYLRTVTQIKEDIYNGKYYEMNYCIGFKSKPIETPLLPLFIKLNQESKAPFAAYLNTKQFSILCNSPERFIYKEGDNLYSQPIKGTNKKHPENNQNQMLLLQNDEKERAENVMIVDLVRNDLSKICETGTVKVEELFGTYAFKSLNHLISTIKGKLKKGNNIQSIFEALFPMGSMTGAPKKEVMLHIDKYENTPRNIYSGCLGYIDPSKNFDFNVVIRSLEFQKTEQTFLYQVGSAITYDSIPENEYEECLLKATNIQTLFK